MVVFILGSEGSGGCGGVPYIPSGYVYDVIKWHKGVRIGLWYWYCINIWDFRLDYQYGWFEAYHHFREMTKLVADFLKLRRKLLSYVTLFQNNEPFGQGLDPDFNTVDIWIFPQSGSSFSLASGIQQTPWYSYSIPVSSINAIFTGSSICLSVIYENFEPIL